MNVSCLLYAELLGHIKIVFDFQLVHPTNDYINIDGFNAPKQTNITEINKIVITKGWLKYYKKSALAYSVLKLLAVLRPVSTNGGVSKQKGLPA